MTIFNGRPLTDVEAQEAFRAALSLWASGVAIVTTLDGPGRRWGFTASAFSSVSLEPPLVLVCLSAEADCHEAFVNSGAYAVNILRSHHRQLALRFAAKSADKFHGAPFLQHPHSPPILADALAVLVCKQRDLITAGDHTILIGAVLWASCDTGQSAPEAALVHLARRFRSIAHEPAHGHDLGPDLPWFF